MSRKNGYLAVRILLSLGLVAALVFWVSGQLDWAAFSDADGDGYDDAWIALYGFGPVPSEPDGVHGAMDDPDMDNLHNFDEMCAGTDPENWDTDGDSMADGWEAGNVMFGLDPLADDSCGDADTDGLSNIEERLMWMTDPLNWDSDMDGRSDGDEVYVYGSNPACWDAPPGCGPDPFACDSDGDGLSDGDEYYIWMTDAWDPDSDDDGLADGLEVHTYGSSPLSPDSDMDGLSDGDEVYVYGTNPACWNMPPGSGDSDGDGLSDGDEAAWMTDPWNPDSDWDGLSDGDEVYVYGTNPAVWNLPPGGGDSDGDGLSDGDEAVWMTELWNPDTDMDGLCDGLEVNTYGCSPTVRDFDADGVCDGDEVYFYGTDPASTDSDGDGMPDYWEFAFMMSGLDPAVDDAAGDTDSDGLPNFGEYLWGAAPWSPDSDCDGLDDGHEVAVSGTLPANPDTDGDGMWDGWELSYGMDPLVFDDWWLDPDGDGWSTYQEYQYENTNPLKSDTDGDGLWDSEERLMGLNPLDPSDGPADFDGDGLPTGWELRYGLNPNDGADLYSDMEPDGLTNGEEFLAGTNPVLSDTDGDGIGDYWELVLGTDPLDGGGDADGDGVGDGEEFARGMDPRDPDTDHDGICDGPLDPDGGGPVIAGPDPYPTTPDADNDGLCDGPLDPDGDGPVIAGPDPFPQNPDSDGDGVSDGPLDPDGSGPLVADKFPFDPAACSDTDDDGYPDFLVGESTSVPPLAADAFPLDPAAWQDSDGDGAPDFLVCEWMATPLVRDAFPFDPAASLDLDFDGMPDALVPGVASTSVPPLAEDPDDDNDSMPDAWETANGYNPLDWSDSEYDGDGDGFPVWLERCYGDGNCDRTAGGVWQRDFWPAVAFTVEGEPLPQAALTFCLTNQPGWVCSTEPVSIPLMSRRQFTLFLPRGASTAFELRDAPGVRVLVSSGDCIVPGNVLFDHTAPDAWTGAAKLTSVELGVAGKNQAGNVCIHEPGQAVSASATDGLPGWAEWEQGGLTVASGYGPGAWSVTEEALCEGPATVRFTPDNGNGSCAYEVWITRCARVCCPHGYFYSLDILGFPCPYCQFGCPCGLHSAHKVHCACLTPGGRFLPYGEGFFTFAVGNTADSCGHIRGEFCCGCREHENERWEAVKVFRVEDVQDGLEIRDFGGAGVSPGDEFEVATILYAEGTGLSERFGDRRMYVSLWGIEDNRYTNAFTVANLGLRPEVMDAEGRCLIKGGETCESGMEAVTFSRLAEGSVRLLAGGGLVFSEGRGCPAASALEGQTNAPPASVEGSRPFWLGATNGGPYELAYELLDPAGGVCCRTNVTVHAVVAEFATNRYYVAYGSAEPLEVGLSGRSYDPAGFVLYLDGTQVGDGQPPFPVDVSGLSAGEHTLMVQSKSFTDLTDTATLIVLTIILEPVTVETCGTGVILNPCGVAAGGLATYRIGVEPAGAVPDEAIRWSVASGGVAFYGGRDTGREVIIRGGASESDFKLEVRIDGLPESCCPYIYGRVLEPKTVQVRAYVICDANGVAAVSQNSVSDWIAEANRIYRQVAVTFTLVSISTVTDHPDWFEIWDDDEFFQMCSYANNTGGLELYCVDNMTDPGQHSDMRITNGDPRRGMAVRGGADLTTLSHEIGHACGLSDMYLYDAGSGLVSEDKTCPLNWSGGDGTGYYSSGLIYRDLTYRTLMHNRRNTDIPLVNLTGMSGPYRTQITVGCKSMNTREPVH